MFFQLLAINLALVTCNAIEHLTCIRNNDAFNPSLQACLCTMVKQGKPGRRGPPGEPGILDNSLVEPLKRG